jgi:hypothetical protein
MAKPTYRDATLMLQLAQWQATLNVGEALNWMWSDQFVVDFEEFVKKYPWGSEESGWAQDLWSLRRWAASTSMGCSMRLALRLAVVSAVWEGSGLCAGGETGRWRSRLYENFEALAAANAAYDARLAKRSSATKRAKK